MQLFHNVVRFTPDCCKPLTKLPAIASSWKRTLWTGTLSLFLAASLQAQTPSFTIDKDFPGGNIIVEGIEGDTVKLVPDNRGSQVPWFYWYFAVRGAAGKTLTFSLPPRCMGVRGPGVSTDGGITWKYMGMADVKEGTFTYTFPPGSGEVRFSNGMPYVQSSFERFLQQYKGNPNIHLGVLGKSSRAGRDVEMLKIAAPGVKARYVVAITARHHSSEMMGNYLVEGIIQGALADDEQGKWLRANVEFIIVPFMDKDGVEDGEQGKNRTPHDHNRDYDKTPPLYSEVAALKAQFPGWTANRPFLFFDIHNPALKGDVHEVMQLLEPQEPAQAALLARYSEILERDHQGTIQYRKNMVMKFGTGYNGIMSMPPPIAAGWARTLPNCLMGVSIEIPYAEAAGNEVNVESGREFGRDMAWAIQALLEEQSATGTK